MRFRFWLEEITRIRLEDAVREGRLVPLHMQHLVFVRTDERHEKEIEVKNTQLGGEEANSSIHLVGHALSELVGY